MRTTTTGIHRTSSTSLPGSAARSAIAIGLPIAIASAVALGAGAAQAQTAPDPAPADAAQTVAPQAPPQAVVDANPLAEQQLEQVRKMVQAMPKIFEFDGYLRSGFGINDKGGAMDSTGINGTFQAPGAYSKYRLGNESDLYSELGLTANWLNPDHNDTWFKTKVKIGIQEPHPHVSFESLITAPGNIVVREAYGEAGHIFDSHPEVSIWAGQRFYRRRDVHIIDFFFNDMSGYGAGFQDLKVGDKMKLNVAYLGGSVENPTGPGAPAPSDVGRLTKNTFDIRLSDIPAGPGNLEILLLPTFGAQGSGAVRNQGGMGGGLFWFVPMMGGFNEISAQFGYRGAANLSTSVDNSIARDGWLFRAVDRAVFQLQPKLSMMATAVLQFDNRDGTPTGSTDSGLGNTWFSLGARPVYMFGKYTGIAVEGGVDVVQSQTANSPTGILGKLTVAPLIRPAADFWARPELRAFVTVATWDNSIKGQVGGPAFANDTAGLTAGVQVESWW